MADTSEISALWSEVRTYKETPERALRAMTKLSLRAAELRADFRGAGRPNLMTLAGNSDLPSDSKLVHDLAHMVKQVEKQPTLAAEATWLIGNVGGAKALVTILDAIEAAWLVNNASGSADLRTAQINALMASLDSQILLELDAVEKDTLARVYRRLLSVTAQESELSDGASQIALIETLVTLELRAQQLLTSRSLDSALDHFLRPGGDRRQADIAKITSLREMVKPEDRQGLRAWADEESEQLPASAAAWIDRLRKADAGINKEDVRVILEFDDVLAMLRADASAAVQQGVED